MVSKAVFSRRISADIAGGIAIGLYACNISNTIIHVNEGFVKGFVVLTDKLTERVVKKKDRQMSVLVVNTSYFLTVQKTIVWF